MKWLNRQEYPLMTETSLNTPKRLTRKQKRLLVIAGLAVVVGLAAALILTALRDQIVFFYSPTELMARPELAGEAVRIGGLVEQGTFERNGETNQFSITDGNSTIAVTFIGLLPDLFREGQGVIAEGSLTDAGDFSASNVLAKHDETYIPREVEAALREQGVWQGGE